MKKLLFALLSVVMLVAFSVSVSFSSHEIPKPDVVKVEKSFVSADVYQVTINLSEACISPRHSYRPDVISVIELPNITTKTIAYSIRERSWRFSNKYKEIMQLNNKPIHSVSYSICARHKC